MFNKTEFQVAMLRAGLTSTEVAKQLGIDPSTMYRKIKADGDFSRSEINKLVEILKLESPNDIFFA